MTTIKTALRRWLGLEGNGNLPGELSLVDILDGRGDDLDWRCPAALGLDL